MLSAVVAPIELYGPLSVRGDQRTARGVGGGQQPRPTSRVHQDGVRGGEAGVVDPLPGVGQLAVEQRRGRAARGERDRVGPGLLEQPVGVVAALFSTNRSTLVARSFSRSCSSTSSIAIADCSISCTETTCWPAIVMIADVTLDVVASVFCTAVFWRGLLGGGRTGGDLRDVDRGHALGQRLVLHQVRRDPLSAGVLDVLRRPATPGARTPRRHRSWSTGPGTRSQPRGCSGSAAPSPRRSSGG